MKEIEFPCTLLNFLISYSAVGTSYWRGDESQIIQNVKILIFFFSGSEWNPQKLTYFSCSKSRQIYRSVIFLLDTTPRPTHKSTQPPEQSSLVAPLGAKWLELEAVWIISIYALCTEWRWWRENENLKNLHCYKPFLGNVCWRDSRLENVLVVAVVICEVCRIEAASYLFVAPSGTQKCVSKSNSPIETLSTVIFLNSTIVCVHSLKSTINICCIKYIYNLGLHWMINYLVILAIWTWARRQTMRMSTLYTRNTVCRSVITNMATVRIFDIISANLRQTDFEIK
jgi:hypothetical protein